MSGGNHRFRGIPPEYPLSITHRFINPQLASGPSDCRQPLPSFSIIVNHILNRYHHNSEPNLPILSHYQSRVTSHSHPMVMKRAAPATAQSAACICLSWRSAGNPVESIVGVTESSIVVGMWLVVVNGYKVGKKR